MTLEKAQTVAKNPNRYSKEELALALYTISQYEREFMI
jgi:hypothetical protein